MIPLHPLKGSILKVVIAASGTSALLIIIGVVLVYAMSDRASRGSVAVIPESPSSVQRHAGSLPPAQVTPASIMLFGDIMLGRNVEVKMKANGYAYPYDRIREQLQSADLLLANLEGPIPRTHTPTPTGSVRFSFLPAAVQQLGKEGFDIVSLANNHTFDHGAKDFTNTQEQIRTAGMETVGHPNMETDAYAVTREIRGQKITFIGFNAFRSSFNHEQAVATVASLSQPADARVVVLIHWGTEYVLKHNQAQEDLAHQLLDAGASVIIGHHPHVTQDIELYKNKLIFYSLGNFIFDQYFSQDTQEGLAITAEFGDGLERYTIMPHMSKASQPEFMAGEQRELFLKALAERSSPDLKDQIMTGTISFVEAL